jgi:hypothetical protein
MAHLPLPLVLPTFMIGALMVDGADGKALSNGETVYDFNTSSTRFTHATLPSNAMVYS